MNLTAPVIFPDFFVSNVFLIPPIFGTSFSYYYGWSFCWFSPTVLGVWWEIRGYGREFAWWYLPSRNSGKTNLEINGEKMAGGKSLDLPGGFPNPHPDEPTPLHLYEVNSTLYLVWSFFMLGYGRYFFVSNWLNPVVNPLSPLTVLISSQSAESRQCAPTAQSKEKQPA